MKGIDEHGSLTIVQDAKGNHRWILRSASGFRDRDGELITTKALSDDCERLNESGNFGPLRWWHIGSKAESTLPPLDIGDCDMSMMLAHTRIESGTFRAPWIGRAMAIHVKELGGSLGFKYRGLGADKTIDYLRTFERSLLPKQNASNLMALKQRLFGKSEDAMTEAEQVAKLKELVGPDNHALVDSFLASSKRDEGTLSAMGVGVKESKKDEAKEDPKEEAAETPAEEAKENADEMKKKTKEAETQTAELVAQISDAIATKMAGAFVTPAMLDAKFAELQATGTKAQSEQTTALKALSDRIAVLEGETPESKRGFKASSATDSLVANPLMLQALQSLASTQGLDLSALGVKGAQPVDDTTRITERMMNFKPGSMGA